MSTTGPAACTAGSVAKSHDVPTGLVTHTEDPWRGTLPHRDGSIEVATGMQILSTQAFTADAPRRVVAVDWSGAVSGAGRGIWHAEVEIAGVELTTLRGGWSRETLPAHLIALAERERRLVVGLDFAFSLPRWFLEERGYPTAAALWADVSACEQWATECPAPFWGRGAQHTRPALLDQLPRLRRTEQEVRQRFGVEPKSVFQLGGAGTVGTGSLRGMRVLSQLREAGFSIWPFDAPRLPLVVEIYPRLHALGVRVGDAASRAAHLERHGWPADADLRRIAAGDPNAFDAAVSGFALARNGGAAAELPPARDDDDRLEGRIWVPGALAPAADGAGPGFFSTPFAPPSPPTTATPPPPPWMPQPGVLGVGVPGQHLVARSDRAAVVLDGLTAFPSGLAFRIELWAREAGGIQMPFHPFPVPGREKPGALRFGVELPDGSRSDGNLLNAVSGRGGGAVLLPQGGGGGDRRWHQDFWLWPLPGPGALRVVCQWADMGIDESELELDTEPLIDAASRATRFWD